MQMERAQVHTKTHETFSIHFSMHIYHIQHCGQNTSKNLTRQGCENINATMIYFNLFHALHILLFPHSNKNIEPFEV